MQHSGQWVFYGVPQGCYLGPILFGNLKKLMMLKRFVSSAHFLLFAIDLKQKKVNSVLDSFVAHCKYHYLEFNDHIFNPSEEIPHRVDMFKDLDVALDKYVSFRAGCSRILCRL